MRQFLIVASIVASIVAVPAWANADTVTLVNGVEIRNAKILRGSEDTDKIVVIEIIGMTRLVLGKSEVASMTGSAEKVVPPPPPPPPPIQPVPSVSPVPDVPAAPDVPPAPSVPQSTPTVSVRPLKPATPPALLPPPPQSKGMTQILKVATRQANVSLEFHVTTSPETGITYTVKTSQPPPASRRRTYTIKTIEGAPVQVMLNWDTKGEVVGSVVSPPEPPSDSMEGVYDYTFVTVGGEKFKIRAIWDVLNLELLETKIIL